MCDVAPTIIIFIVCAVNGFSISVCWCVCACYSVETLYDTPVYSTVSHANWGNLDLLMHNFFHYLEQSVTVNLKKVKTLSVLTGKVYFISFCTCKRNQF